MMKKMLSLVAASAIMLSTVSANTEAEMKALIAQAVAEEVEKNPELAKAAIQWNGTTKAFAAVAVVAAAVVAHKLYTKHWLFCAADAPAAADATGDKAAGQATEGDKKPAATTGDGK